MSIYTDLHIVAIDDDKNMREMLSDFITSKFNGARLTTFSSGEEAISGLSARPDLIILDYHLDSANPMALNGLQILQKLRSMYPDAQVVFLSSQESTEVAANTMKYGAFDYILKNEFAFQRLELVVRNIMGNSDLRKNAGTQRFFNYLLAGLVIALVLGILYTRMA